MTKNMPHMGIELGPFGVEESMLPTTLFRLNFKLLPNYGLLTDRLYLCRLLMEFTDRISRLRRAIGIIFEHKFFSSLRSTLLNLFRFHKFKISFNLLFEH